MAVFRGTSGANVDFSSAAALSVISWPTGTVNTDTVFWVLLFNVASGATPVNITSVPSGWTTVVSVTHGTYRLLVLSHAFATGEATSSYTVTTDDTTGGIVYMSAIAYSSVSNISTPTTSTGASGNASVTTGGVRGSGLYLAILANEAGVTSLPGSGTERFDVSGATTLTAIEQGASTTPTNITNTWSSTAAGWLGAVIPLDVGGVTIGATLSTVAFPLRHAGMGPFKSSAGNIYFFGRDTTNTGQIEPHKATDPMTAFTAQTAKTMSSATTTAIEAAACYQVADVIHVATQISTGLVMYNSFNMATDAWTLTTSETAVAAASFAPTTGYTFVSFVVRSGGEVDVGYCAGLTAMSSGFNMVRYIRRTGVATWTGAINVDNGGSVNWSNGIVVLGASDRIHFFFKDQTNSDAYQRTLTSANALQTFPAALDATVTADVHVWDQGISYVSGASTLVRAPYADVGPVVAVASLSSADAPTVSATTPVSGAAQAVQQGQQVAAMVADGTTEHLLYADSATQDLWHDSNSGSGWGADIEEWDAATINRVSANVYDRSGTKLAMVVDDGGAIKYAEIALAAAVTTSYPHKPNPVFQHILNLR